MTAPYRISLAMIARDEARCIVRCLDSVRDVVDEMIVVDTGSVDDTVALAEGAGATVHHFAWVDDFARAKNVALSHCTGDWILVLDADEWLTSGHETLRALRSTKPPFFGVVELVNHANEESTSVQPQIRLLPAGARYAGRIHEQVQDIGELRRLPVRIEHDGYLPEQRQTKVDRNRPLLEASLLEEPDNAYLWFQLGVEHAQDGSPAAACLGFERALQLSDATGQTSPVWRHELLLRYLVGLLQTGRTQDAIDVAFAELEHWQHSADFQYMLGHVLLRYAAENPAAREEVVPLAEQAWRTCLELGDSNLSGSVVGHGSFLAARELVRLYEALGRTADADRVRPLTQP